jgi:hypothetical protein
LTGDAETEKTGLDGRFFCVWDLVAQQPAIHSLTFRNIRS